MQHSNTRRPIAQAVALVLPVRPAPITLISLMALALTLAASASLLVPMVVQP
jgi:hypothetical protein